jgi:LacI family transcriptional regulator
MKATLVDIARDCNVAVGTVSNILNNKGSFKEETRQRVQESMRRLKYKGAERLLNDQHHAEKTIGLILPSPAADNDTFFSRAISAATAGTSRIGCNFILLSEQEVIERLGNAADGECPFPCAGLICFCPTKNYNAYLARLRQHGLPAVLIRRETDVPDVPVITDNDRTGTILALEHLHRLGHSRIGMIRRTTGIDLKEHLAGYREVVRTCHLVADERLVVDVHQHNHETFNRTMDDLMASDVKPSAFFCESDDLAIGMVKWLSAHNFRVPADVAVVGYDDDVIAEKFSPGITTVKIPVREMIGMAVDLLAFRIANKWQDNYRLVGSSQRFELAAELVVRESCGSPDGKSEKRGVL